MSVKERGERVPRHVWRKALSCADMLDAFPCRKCGSTGRGCDIGITQSEVEATRDYINGYGWKAAYKLAGGDPLETPLDRLIKQSRIAYRLSGPSA
jgi:hypothetical protein